MEDKRYTLELRPLETPRRGWVLLKWILEKQDGVVLSGLIYVRIGTKVNFCEHGNENSDSIKCWKILYDLRKWRLFEKGSSPW
jgi:hypothetical protein